MIESLNSSLMSYKKPLFVDLISVRENFLKLSVILYFQLVTVDMDAMSMDKFCFCVAQKKVCSKLHKEKNDLVSIQHRCS